MCTLPTILGSTDLIDFLADSGPPKLFDFGGILPLGIGTYSISPAGLGIAVGTIEGVDPVVGWSADYEWTLRVVPVSEPQTFTLLGASLFTWYLRRRRRS